MCQLITGLMERKEKLWSLFITTPLLTNAFIKINAGALPQELIEAELLAQKQVLIPRE